MKPSRCQIGFTYLEFAAALIIIIFVVAILFPVVFQRVHENARRTACASNMKQLGLAFIQYTNDADSKMTPGVNALKKGWAGQLYPYIKSTRCFQCPDENHDGTNLISYAENQWVAGQSVAKFTNPSSTVVLYELTTINCDPSIHESISAMGMTAPQNDPRHDRNKFALNFLSVDGHVKYLRPAAISSGPNPVKPKPDMGNGYVMTFAGF